MMIAKSFFILIPGSAAVICSYLTQIYKWYGRGAIQSLFSFVLLLPYWSLFDSFCHRMLVGRLLLQKTLDLIRFNAHLWKIARKPETKFHIIPSLFIHTRAYTIITQTCRFPCMNQVYKDLYKSLYLYK